MNPHTKSIRIGTPYKRRGSLWSLGWHTGDDWLTPIGTKALAMADGVVISTSYNSSYGHNVIVETKLDNGQIHRWSVNHLSRIKVKTRQKVRAGQLVGYTGATGHVTGPHDHVEDRVPPFTFSASTFRDPQVMYDWKPKGKIIPWQILRPTRKPPKWFRAVGINMGGFNDHGATTFDTRRPKIVAKIARTKSHAVAVQELPDREVTAFTKAMMAIGYNHIVGSDGRHIYALIGINVGDTGIFDLRPRYKGDDKQAAWALLKIAGSWALVISGHLESDEPADNQRVGQAKDLIKQAENVLNSSGLSKSRLCVLVDTNSAAWVREKAFNEAHYVDSADTAWKRRRYKIATFHGWSRKKFKGPRIDGAFVHRSRPVRYYRTLTNPHLSDHFMIRVDIGRIND